MSSRRQKRFDPCHAPMPRLVPAECQIRPAQIGDRVALAALDRQWQAHQGQGHYQRWRNLAAIAFLSFSILVVLKDWRLWIWVLLGFGPLYLMMGGMHWLNVQSFQRDWINTWIVESGNRLIACAKWQHYDGYSELQQLYVRPQWRFHGVGAALVDRLSSQTQQPIYLLSDRQSQDYFQRFGFRPIAWDDLPVNFPITELLPPELGEAEDQRFPMVLIQRPVQAATPRLPQLKLPIRWPGIAVDRENLFPQHEPPFNDSAQED